MNDHAHERPNIVLVMTDQQRADFTAAAGFPLDTMPFLDQLAARGARFTRAYTPMPVCAPARCSLLSGRYPKATRVRENGGIANAQPGADLITVLRQQGYSINLAGKNHSYLTREDFDFYAEYGHYRGPAERTTPEERAFEEWLTAVRYDITATPTPFPVEVQMCCRVVRDAIACVDGRDARPFFLWLSFPEPHQPYQAPEPYFSLFPEEAVPPPVAGPEVALARGGAWQWLHALISAKHPEYAGLIQRYRATYCGMLRLIDDQLRCFVTHLAEQGLLENTVIVYCSDHGDFAGDYGLARKGVGLPECLARVPFVIVGPGVQPAVRDEYVSLVDVLPTLCEAAGAPLPWGAQGRSLWPVVTGGDFPAAEFRSVYAEAGFGGLPYGADERPDLHFAYPGPRFDELNSVTQSGNLKMVRLGPWKLTYDLLGEGHLYNLDDDPAELHDRYSDPACRDARQQLTEELLRWTIRTEDDLPGGRYQPKSVARNWHACVKEQSA